MSANPVKTIESLIAASSLGDPSEPSSEELSHAIDLLLAVRENPRATPGFYSVKTESMQPTIDLVDAAAARMQRLRRQLRANARPPVVVVRGGTEEAQVTGDRARSEKG